MGEGTGVAEVHGDPADPSKDTDLELDVKVYNGSLDTDKDGIADGSAARPADLHRARRYQGTTIPFWGEKRGRQLAFRAADEDPEPGVADLYVIKEIHLQDRSQVRP